MDKLLRASLLIALVLAIPVIPFFIWGERFETWFERWLSPPPSAKTIFWLTITALSTDVFLPVPSSLISTLAGTKLAIPLAILASWLGLTVAAVFGFAVARAFGRPLAIRFSNEAELDRLDRLSERFGPRVLVLVRALPVLAEASVLLFGATRFSWRRFLPPVALANLGIATAYSVLGHFGRTQNVTAYVLAASVALPLLATTMVRWRYGQRSSVS
jgi:membrane protein DedA with SNARE-associated domain